LIDELDENGSLVVAYKSPIIQKLDESKLVTYPRTDARVLSTAVAKVISRNIAGLKNFAPVAAFAEELEKTGNNKLSASSKYVNDKQITDHYAIIPTGEGFGALGKLSNLEKQVYEMICRRFLSIFYPPAKYRKFQIELVTPNGEHTEHFFAAFKTLIEEGYLKVAGIPKGQDAKKDEGKSTAKKDGDGDDKDEKKDDENAELDLKNDPEMLSRLEALKKNDELTIRVLSLKESETKPPSRYNSGSMILAMENAGNLIEDEELRSQIKGSGIGTSATRHEVLKKLVTNGYINLNQNTQIITPTYFGEMIYDVTDYSMKSLLNPTFTASWEKGLEGVVKGEISKEEYMTKLTDYIRKRTSLVKTIDRPEIVAPKFDVYEEYYRKSTTKKRRPAT
ncbi:MAG: type IA DNA topoisomerase, partial [Lachnospiraceae bacterium]|nr:type IA DNA topoisomerase [Lachnospiraceae bacterium]